MGRRASEAGFTLLELLIVLFIVGLLSGLAVVSMGGSHGGGVMEEGRRMRELFQLASREAVFSFKEIGLSFSQEGFSFLEYTGDGVWSPLVGDDILRSRALPQGMSLSLRVEGNGVTLEKGAKASPPQVFFLSSGEMTPFTLALRREGEDPMELSGHSTGELLLSRTIP